MKRLVYFFLFSAILLGSMACDEHISDVAPDAEMIRNGSIRTSKFTLAKELLAVDGDIEVLVRLRSLQHGRVLNCPTRITKENKRLHVYMTLPNDSVLHDGDYHLIVSESLQKRLSNRLLVSFQNELLTGAKKSEMVCKLPGNGMSIDDPFLINSQSQFNEMLYSLSTDPGHGFGYYYKQTASFVAPLKGRDQQGSFYCPQAFAGTYFGTGKETLTIQYSGGGRPEADECIGMFSELFDGAHISDLRINMQATGIYRYGGAVAGKTHGKVLIENVIATGSISQQGNYIGGLVGYGSDQLTIKQCAIGLSLSNWDYVGGAVGYFKNGTLTIDGLTNRDKSKLLNFAVSGHNDVGGVIGHFEQASASISNVDFRLLNEEERDDLNMVYSSYENMGGLMGNLHLTTSNVTLTDCQLHIPIEGGYSVGGLIGLTNLGGSGTLTLSGCGVGGRIKGRMYVGGYFGKFNYLVGQLNHYFKIQSSDKHQPSIKTSAGEAVRISAKEDYAGGIFGEIRPQSPYFDTIECSDADAAFDASVYISIDYYAGKGGYVAGSAYACSFQDKDFTWGSKTVYMKGKEETDRPFGLNMNSSYIK